MGLILLSKYICKIVGGKEDGGASRAMLDKANIFKVMFSCTDETINGYLPNFSRMESTSCV